MMKTHLSRLAVGLMVSQFMFACSHRTLQKDMACETFCNPINIDYGFGGIQQDAPFRSAADPVIVPFKGRYYLFTTMDRGGYRVSDDLVRWETIDFVSGMESVMDSYGYMAPAVATDGVYLYFINFRGGSGENPDDKIDVIRTSDPESGVWEVCGSTMSCPDPCLLLKNGHAYIYHGLGVDKPTRFFEADPKTFSRIEGSECVLRQPVGEVDTCSGGYHRGRRELYAEVEVPSDSFRFANKPCPEAPWVTHIGNTYYLQYSTPGTVSQWYSDVLMTSKNPGGPFHEVPYNPVSMKVGGFMGSAGHSCVFCDWGGHYWEVSTMWVGAHDDFERRIGLFPVTFDDEGRMRVHTALGDYPQPLSGVDIDSEYATPYMLVSRGAARRASSTREGHEPVLSTDENSRTCWSAATGKPGEWLELELCNDAVVHAVQVNMADIGIPRPESDWHAYTLSCSDDGITWRTIIDRSDCKDAVPHDYVQLSTPVKARYFRLTNVHTPEGQLFAVSGLRLFGNAYIDKPQAVRNVTAERSDKDTRNASISWRAVDDAEGYLVRFGYSPDFLNQCIQIIDSRQNSLRLHTLSKGQDMYYRIDVYNAAGVTMGTVHKCGKTG